MLTPEQNELLTRVGPGSRMGALMRRYWHPVATAWELKANPVKPVRILGESLTLYRDRKGRLGLIGQRCAHRGVDLKCGIPEEEGLRCPYHGWLYDRTGQCVAQPAELAEHDFSARMKLASYPVEELGGLVWAWLGPEPRPLLPRWDLFVMEDCFRQIGTATIPCNWLQCQENAVDTMHTEFAHGRFGFYSLERLGISDPRQLERFKRISRHHVKIDFKEIPTGIQKFRLLEGEKEEESEGWRTGHPMIFPNYVRVGQVGYSEFQIRVPIDDTHTWHLAYQVNFPGNGVKAPRQDPVPAFEVPQREHPDFVLGQDMACWTAQGPISDRTAEHLGRSDRGLLLFRRMLLDQLKIVEAGGDPMNTFRDPATNQRLDLSLEDRGGNVNYRKGTVRYMNLGDSSPFNDELDALMQRGSDASREKQES